MSEKAHVENGKSQLQEAEVTGALHFAKSTSLAREARLVSSEAGVQRPIFQGGLVIFTRVEHSSGHRNISHLLNVR